MNFPQLVSFLFHESHKFNIARTIANLKVAHLRVLNGILTSAKWHTYECKMAYLQVDGRKKRDV